MNDNFNMNETETKKDIRKITFLSVGIMTLVVAIAGATFAYFTVTATSSDIDGESGYVENALTIAVEQVLPSGTDNEEKALIPQLDDAIDTAVTSSYNCIDGNGNAVCKVFKITVTNATTNKYFLTGNLTLTADTMPNLKWSKCTAANVCTGTANAKTVTTLVDAATGLAGGDSLDYYVVVWISEQGSAQTDSGSFSGTVEFNGFNDENKTSAGVTSTIRS